MTSRFGWVDQDDDQRRRMLAVVELFKDEGSVDELGIGSIRDAVADALFPGTSVLQTRARYLLMIPWLLQQAAQGTGGENAAEELRRREGKLIYALLAGGETDGVIGQQAKEKLKRMPSAAYWAAIGRFGIRNVDATVEGFLRLQVSARQAGLRSVRPDDPGAAVGDDSPLLHPDLPPAPEGLLTESSFQLTAGEAEFLRERLQTTTAGSLLAWLVSHGVASDADSIWDHPLRSQFPASAQEYVDDGRRFATAVHGAALVYNRLLAERRGSDELIEEYDDLIDAWGPELEHVQPFADGWRPDHLWALLERDGRAVRPATRTFVDTWLSVVQSHGPDACRRPDMKSLVRQREIQLKGGRARLVNAGALDAWRGRSGLVRLDYRWRVARRLLTDLEAAGTQEAA